MDWFENPWPGCVLRLANLDKQGHVVSEEFKRVPLDRDLQDAMDWAAVQYRDPSRPLTPLCPENLLRELESRLHASRPTSMRTTR